MAKVKTVPPLNIPRYFVQPHLREGITTKGKVGLEFPGRYAGKKDRLVVSQLKHMLPPPDSYDTYEEACLGTGAMFRYLHSCGHLTGKRVKLIENDRDMANLWKHMQGRPNDMLSVWRKMTFDYSREEYFAMREQFNTSLTHQVTRSIFMLYFLNMSYNGIYRRNRNGEYKVPPRDKVPKKVFDWAKIDRFHQAIQDAEIYWADVRQVKDEKYAPSGSFLYVDPPYTNSPLVYGKDVFGPRQFLHLLSTCRKTLSKRGVSWMISNGFDINFLPQELDQEDFNWAAVFRPDTVNSRRKKKDERGNPVTYFCPESVLRNYTSPPRDKPYLKQAAMLVPLHILQKILFDLDVPFDIAIKDAADYAETVLPFVGESYSPETVGHFVEASRPLLRLLATSRQSFLLGATTGGRFMQELHTVFDIPGADKIRFPQALSDLAVVNN